MVPNVVAGCGMLEQSLLVLIFLLLLLQEASHLVSYSNLPLCDYVHTLVAAVLSSMIVSLLSNLELALVEFGGLTPLHFTRSVFYS
jgi:hypothetical protein